MDLGLLEGFDKGLLLRFEGGFDEGKLLGLLDEFDEGLEFRMLFGLLARFDEGEISLIWKRRFEDLFHSKR